MQTVAVVCNKLKPFNDVSCPAKGTLPSYIVKWLFLLFPRIRTPHDSKTPTRGRGRKEYTVCRKARGQFPNNPCDWSNHQVEGHTQKRSMMIPFTGVKYLILSTPCLWGRGVFG